MEYIIEIGIDMTSLKCWSTTKILDIPIDISENNLFYYIRLQEEFFALDHYSNEVVLYIAKDSSEGRNLAELITKDSKKEDYLKFLLHIIFIDFAKNSLKALSYIQKNIKETILYSKEKGKYDLRKEIKNLLDITENIW